MADLIKIKGGNGTTPQLQANELGYNKEEKALYIGTENGNVLLCKADNTSVFYAIYGATTGEEINVAYKAGKTIACKITSGDHKGRILQLVTSNENGFTFSCFDYPIAISAEVDGSYWSDITTHNLIQEINQS